jgi:hypothetical protein
VTTTELQAVERRLGQMIEERMSVVKDVRRRTLYGLVAVLMSIGAWWLGDINGRVRATELEQVRQKQETVEIQNSIDRIESKVDALIQKEFPGRQ